MGQPTLESGASRARASLVVLGMIVICAGVYYAIQDVAYTRSEDWTLVHGIGAARNRDESAAPTRPTSSSDSPSVSAGKSTEMDVFTENSALANRWYEKAALAVFCSFGRYAAVPAHHSLYWDVFRDVTYYGPPTNDYKAQAEKWAASNRSYNVVVHSDLSSIGGQYNVRGEYAAIFFALENQTLPDDSPGWIIAHDDAFLVLWNWYRYSSDKMMIGPSAPDEIVDIRNPPQRSWFNHEWAKVNYLRAIEDPDFPLDLVRAGPCKSEFNVTKAQIDVIFIPKQLRQEMIKYTRMMFRHSVFIEIGLASIMYCFFGNISPPQVYDLETRFNPTRHDFNLTRALFRPHLADVVHPIKFGMLGETARIWMDDWLRLKLPSGYLGNRSRAVQDSYGP